MKRNNNKTKRRGSAKPDRSNGAQGRNARAKGGRKARGAVHRQSGRGGADGRRKPEEAGRTRAMPSDPQGSLLVCPVETRCGGCDRVSMPYADQLALKQRSVEELFVDLVSPDGVLPIAGMENPYHYRNKVTSPFAPGRKIGAGARREILTGMYAPHSHRLVPIDECLIENEQAKAVIVAVRSLMPRFGMPPYDEDAHVGFLRHAVVRVGHESGEVLVTLVTNGREFPASRSFCRELVRRCPFVTTVVQNVNMRQTNVILGEEERTLYGPGFILDRLCGLSFRISSHSFYQVNAVQTEVLYRHAIDLACLTGSETVIDAYCGTGTIGLVAAKSGAARVVGVDDVPAAIRDARQNARHNGIANAEFVAADAGDFMRDLAARRGVPAVSRVVEAAVERENASGEGKAVGREAGDGESLDACGDEAVAAAVEEAPAAPPDEIVLFMDPPRAGASEAFLDAACALAPSRIVYISCNPETQVRDIARLARAGYAVRTVQPIDMFPHTAHVETVALIERGGGQPDDGASGMKGARKRNAESDDTREGGAQARPVERGLTEGEDGARPSCASANRQRGRVR